MSVKVVDQTGRSLFLPKAPCRIISCVPSITETLILAGMENAIIGRTKFCIHPSKNIKNIPVIGGTKNLRIKDIFSLNPDLIIANKEENTKEDIYSLAHVIPTFISDISNTDDVLQFLSSLYDIFGNSYFLELKNQLFNLFTIDQCKGPKIKVAYLIWRKPYMTCGQDTFIHHMIEKAGFINVFGNKYRYPEVTLEDIFEANPDYLFLSSEPYPFNEKHIKEINVLNGDLKIKIVDGELFSWYGSRMSMSGKYFKNLRLDLGLSH
jgi:ABC-type Fe3+-hydroxamate transport system substrate-binding protein